MEVRASSQNMGASPRKVRLILDRLTGLSVDQALALPNLTGEQRVRLEDLRTRIDRALTPWPIL